MAEEEIEDGEGQPASGKKGGMIIWLAVIVLAVGGGIATPLVVAKLTPAEGDATEIEVPEEPDPEEEVEFIDFDEVTVNLDEARFSRYLRINFSLQVAKSKRMEIETMIDAKKTIMQNWLQTHVAEKSTDDLKGKFGRNRLRREMHDHFNKVLFKDGIERIQDVLFREFHVQ